MKKAFTMVELIFVIVILGVLASVAIPKLAATRDDAIITRTNANLKNVISEVMVIALAKGDVDSNLTNISPTLRSMINTNVARYIGNKIYLKGGLETDCIVLDVNSSRDIVIDVVYKNTIDAQCKAFQTLANVKEYKLKLRGTDVKY